MARIVGRPGHDSTAGYALRPLDGDVRAAREPVVRAARRHLTSAHLGQRGPTHRHRHPQLLSHFPRMSVPGRGLRSTSARPTATSSRSRQPLGFGWHSYAILLAVGTRGCDIRQDKSAELALGPAGTEYAAARVTSRLSAQRAERSLPRFPKVLVVMADKPAPVLARTIQTLLEVTRRSPQGAECLDGLGISVTTLTNSPTAPFSASSGGLADPGAPVGVLGQAPRASAENGPPPPGPARAGRRSEEREGTVDGTRAVVAGLSREVTQVFALRMVLRLRMARTTSWPRPPPPGRRPSTAPGRATARTGCVRRAGDNALVVASRCRTASTGSGPTPTDDRHRGRRQVGLVERAPSAIEIARRLTFVRAAVPAPLRAAAHYAAVVGVGPVVCPK